MDILKKDSLYRKNDVKDDIYFLKSLQTDSSWNLTYPTLVNVYKRNVKVNRNLSDFIKMFNKECFLLNPDNVDMSNLLIAGGCIRSIILSDRIKDIDIFIYGLNQEESVNKINKFIKDLYYSNNQNKNFENIKRIPGLSDQNKERLICICKQDSGKTRISSTLSGDDKILFDKYYKLFPNYFTGKSVDGFKIINSGNVITINFEDSHPDIQIILRCYETVSSILHGFDLGSSAVGYDGNNVMFTSLGKFSYENMVNIFDHTRRSTTYERRLRKYFNNGFNIVLPELDISKLRLDNLKYEIPEVCDMPYLTFSYKNVDLCSIIVDKFFKFGETEVCQNDSDYSYADLLENEFILSDYNLKQLTKNSNRFIHVIDICEELNNFKNIEDFLENWVLEFTNNPVKWENVCTFYEKQLDSLLENTINVNILNKNFSKDIISSEGILKFINDVYLTNKTKHQRKELIMDLINKQKEFIRKKQECLNSLDHESRKLKWYKGDPMSQLTSSVNPIFESSDKWYGSYFKS
jgi:hypothetical protein